MNSTILSRVVAVILLGGAVIAQAMVPPQGADTKVAVDIRSQGVREALQMFAQQTGLQVLFRSEGTSIEGVTVPEVTGELTAREALDRVLVGTGLTYEFVNDRTVRVAAESPTAGTAAGSSGFFRLAQAGSDESATTDESAQAGAGLQEIVVTAQRREQSVQDVSASVTALSNSDLQRLGADNFSGFALTVPGLSLQQTTRNASYFIIRGVSTTSVGSNAQNPVAVYINDALVADTYGAIAQPDLRLFDIDHVEVLRGPQGTLFGSGSLGGAIRILTKQPDLHNFDATVRADLADTRGGAIRQRYDAMVNLPLADEHLALRAVGYYRDEEGWVKNPTLGTKNSTEDWGGRLALLWAPTDDVSARLEYMHQTSDPRDGDSWNPEAGRFVRTAVVSEGRPLKFDDANLTLQYRIADFADLTSSTTYQTSKSGLSQEIAPFIGDLYVVSRSQPWDSKFITQEFRAVSNTKSSLEWVAGAFYIRRRTDINYVFDIPGINDAFGGGLPLGDSYFLTKIHTRSRELAGYANADYHFTDRWTVSAGVRVFDDTAGYSEPFRQVLNLSNFGVDTSSFENKGGGKGTTWKGGLSFAPSRDVLTYLTVSKGFRIGQANPNNGPSVLDPNDVLIPETYDSDSAVNYELGLKTELLDRRLTLNASTFYIDWTDIQVDASRLSDHLSFTDNAGKATSKGIELELAAALAGFNLGLQATFQKSTIDSIDAQSSARTGVTAGERLPGSVKNKISGYAQYTWRLIAERQLYLRVDAAHVGNSTNNWRFQAGAPGTPNPFFGNNDAYSNVNASLGLVTDRWELALYGENLTDNDSFILNNSGQTHNPVNTLAPRTGGVRATYRFSGGK